MKFTNSMPVNLGRQTRKMVIKGRCTLGYNFKTFFIEKHSFIICAMKINLLRDTIEGK